MSGMLSALCSHYYKLKIKLHKRDDYYKVVFDNVLTFNQNVRLSELDAILASGNKAVEAFDKTLITYEKVKETEQQVVNILKKMGVRPNWTLTGEIPDELEYEVWYDDKDKLYVIKTRDLEPAPKNPNRITIHIPAGGKKEEDDDSYMDDMEADD